ncbi:MAG: fused MFS/spermidine synthase [Spirochaetia bacterium]|nr:fused MFS/spermidine synthase [Spirochaetia bacterium]
MSGRTVTEYLNPGQGMFYRAGDTLASARTEYQDAELVDTSAFGRVLLLDGVTQVAERWEYRYHEPLVHPAMLAHPEPRRVLVIGGGDGGVLREVLRHRAVERVDFAELDPAVVSFSREHLACVHAGAFDDGRVAFHYGDGRAFVENSSRTYDVVVMDMTDPLGPSRFLYTREFFSAVRARLSGPQAVFAMHGESPAARPAAFACIGATLRAVFARVDTALSFVPMYGTLWGFRYASDAGGPAAMDPARVDAMVAARLASRPALISGALWPALFAPDPLIAEAQAHPDGRVITDAEPDFPDVFDPKEGRS